MNTADALQDNIVKLPDELSKNSAISHRTLAARLAIALGHVNSYINRPCGKGFIRISTLCRNRLKYIVTIHI